MCIYTLWNNLCWFNPKTGPQRLVSKFPNGLIPYYRYNHIISSRSINMDSIILIIYLPL